MQGNDYYKHSAPTGFWQWLTRMRSGGTGKLLEVAAFCSNKALDKNPALNNRYAIVLLLHSLTRASGDSLHLT